MKAYSDIEQSKKLAEILPLESADMHYNNVSIKGINYVDEHRAELMEYNRAIKVLSKYTMNPLFEVIPCWSLAALLDVLPRFIEFKGDKYYLRFMKEYIEYANDEISITGRCLHTTGNDNLVDACYEMIVLLKENNLL